MAFDKENPATFIIYADFETILVSVDDGKIQDITVWSTEKKTKHQVCGYSYVVVSRFTEPKYVTYRGEDAGVHFLKSILKEEQEIIKFEKKRWTWQMKKQKNSKKQQHVISVKIPSQTRIRKKKERGIRSEIIATTHGCLEELLITSVT